MIEKLCNMVEMLLEGEYDPLRFSIDFPDSVIENWNEGLKENHLVMEIFDDKFPDICAAYERGENPQAFIEQISMEYERVKKQLNK